MTSSYHLLALSGAALFLASRKKKRKRPSSEASDSASDSASDVEAGEDVEEGEEEEWEEGGGGLIDEDELFEEIGGEDDDIPGGGGGGGMLEPATPAEIVLALEHPNKKAHLGGLYQIRPGDNLVTIAREALYNTRETINDAAKRNAVLELAVRIDCSPWNQALYGAAPGLLNPGHPAINDGVSSVGVSFNPIYTDNRSRMITGMAPSAASGTKFAFLYIPMINLDLLDMEGTVTTKGMNYPDTIGGLGHSMIDPPGEILDFGFDDIVLSQVGCNLPEGDFRKTMQAN